MSFQFQRVSFSILAFSPRTAPSRSLTVSACVSVAKVSQEGRNE
jgi:hypothetical protein